MKQKTVYTLKCPIDGKVKYVGVASDLNLRFYQHLRCKENAYNAIWIKYLKKNRLIPIMEEVETIDASISKQAEIYWINQFREWGFKLHNTQHNISHLTKRLYLYTMSRNDLKNYTDKLFTNQIQTT